MSELATDLMIALLGALATGIPAAYAIWRQRKKIDAEHRKIDAEGNAAGADAAQLLTGAALNMVQRWEARVVSLECEVDRLKERVNALEEENENLVRGASRLEGQVISLGQEPVWRVGSLRKGTAPAG